ncbi:hypothetical protein E2C01_078471 [Portunus trituberculatus]|uniref:Uncharacterized protein n=1 Tax=Portunus trituberculatus TaxID=210409 RepID=A0A5B7IMZ5_PORTR|nr:hypothetical protein [Portunus trituberculatus]
MCFTVCSSHSSAVLACHCRLPPAAHPLSRPAVSLSRPLLLVLTSLPSLNHETPVITQSTAIRLQADAALFGRARLGETHYPTSVVGHKAKKQRGNIVQLLLIRGYVPKETNESRQLGRVQSYALYFSVVSAGQMLSCF